METVRTQGIQVAPALEKRLKRKRRADQSDKAEYFGKWQTWKEFVLSSEHPTAIKQHALRIMRNEDMTRWDNRLALFEVPPKSDEESPLGHKKKKKQQVEQACLQLSDDQLCERKWKGIRAKILTNEWDKRAKSDQVQQQNAQEAVKKSAELIRVYEGMLLALRLFSNKPDVGCAMPVYLGNTSGLLIGMTNKHGSNMVRAEVSTPFADLKLHLMVFERSWFEWDVRNDDPALDAVEFVHQYNPSGWFRENNLNPQGQERQVFARWNKTHGRYEARAEFGMLTLVPVQQRRLFALYQLHTFLYSCPQWLLPSLWDLTVVYATHLLIGPVGVEPFCFL